MSGQKIKFPVKTDKNTNKNGLPCKLCSHLTAVIRVEAIEADYYYCSHCGYISIDEDKILTPEKEQARYRSHINIPDDFGYVEMFRTFIGRSILPFQGEVSAYSSYSSDNCSRHLTALDFGSGPGPVLSVLLREQGYEVDLYDVYFAPELVFEGKTYDLITCTEVLEHLRNPIVELRSMVNHLNPGGILAVMTLFHPVDVEVPESVNMFKQWWYRRDSTHISFFNRQTVEYIAELLGMDIEMIDEKNTFSLRKKSEEIH